MRTVKKLAREVLRYSAVGISAFLIDSATLIVCKQFLFVSLGTIGTVISTCIGFAVGNTYNYIFSHQFVFPVSKQKYTGHHLWPFTVFLLISLIGLFLTTLGMYVGVLLFGDHLYISIKIAVAALVFVWNNTARRLLLYREE